MATVPPGQSPRYSVSYKQAYGASAKLSSIIGFLEILAGWLFSNFGTAVSLKMTIFVSGAATILLITVLLLTALKAHWKHPLNQAAIWTCAIASGIPWLTWLSFGLSPRAGWLVRLVVLVIAALCGMFLGNDMPPEMRNQNRR